MTSYQKECNDGKMSDDEFIAHDAELHQGCNYSSSKSTSCRSVNGESRCETLRRIFRKCPGEKKIEILTRKETSENEGLDGDILHGSDSVPGFFGTMGPFGGFREEHGIPSIMEDMMKSFEDMFQGPFGFGRDFDEDPFSTESERFGRPVQPPHYNKRRPNSEEDIGDADTLRQRKPHPWKPKSKSAEDIFDGYNGKVEEV